MLTEHLLSALVWISVEETIFEAEVKGVCVGRRVGADAAAKSRGVGGGRIVGDKTGVRWYRVQGLPGRSLDFLPLTPRVGAAFSRSMHLFREMEMGRSWQGPGEVMGMRRLLEFTLFQMPAAGGGGGGGRHLSKG